MVKDTLKILQTRHRSSHKRSYIKKVFLRISQNSQENACARLSFVIKLQAETCIFIKRETLAQVFSYEFYKIFKNTFFTEHIETTVNTARFLKNTMH